MLQLLLSGLGKAFHPSRAILMWVLLVGGLLLAITNAFRVHNARQAAVVDRAAVRAELLDSLQRAGELQARAVRQSTDTTLTHRAAQQRAAAEILRHDDERLEKRYRANRLFLPAY